MLAWACLRPLLSKSLSDSVTASIQLLSSAQAIAYSHSAVGDSTSGFSLIDNTDH